MDYRALGCIGAPARGYANAVATTLKFTLAFQSLSRSQNWNRLSWVVVHDAVLSRSLKGGANKEIMVVATEAAVDL